MVDSSAKRELLQQHTSTCGRLKGSAGEDGRRIIEVEYFKELQSETSCDD